MDNSKYLYYVWLTQIKGIGPITARKLMDSFKCAETIYNLQVKELLQVEGVGKETAERIVQSKELITAEAIIRSCNNYGINIIVLDDDIFPENLKQNNEAPIVLYYKGTLYKSLSGVAIVGARRCTDYGKRVTVEASEFLSKNNIEVISGMAKGIDSYAHTACLKSDGFTIAVLGCSVDICYPKEHSELMKKIIEKGLIISEYPPNTDPKPENFPNRNKIISALCSKVLVTEAGEKSGSLITAQYAIKQKKEVYAVPGGIYSRSSIGTNKLIADGAKIYLNPTQLLYENTSPKSFAESKVKVRIIEEEEDNLCKSIIALLKKNPLTIDDIESKVKIDKIELTNILFLMELDNKIKALGGKYQLCTK